MMRDNGNDRSDDRSFCENFHNNVVIGVLKLLSNLIFSCLRLVRITFTTTTTSGDYVKHLRELIS